MSFIDIDEVELVYRNAEGEEAGDGTLALSGASLLQTFKCGRWAASLISYEKRLR